MRGGGALVATTFETGATTVSTAGALVSLPVRLKTTTRYAPAWAAWALLK